MTLTTLDEVTPSSSAHPLPVDVRRHLIELSAAVLGELNGPEVPSSLVRVRAFAPARRPRAGAGPLSVALERDPGFRQQVGAAWRALHPELAADVDVGTIPGAVDPALALAGVYLLRPPDWTELADALTDAVALARTAADAAESDAAARDALVAARNEVDRLRTLVADQRRRIEEIEGELATARREVRRVRSDADRTRAVARTTVEEATAERRRLAEEARRQTARAREMAEEMRRSAEQLEQARRAGREGRSLADTRARLLLDTVIDAASGLRRELALPPVDVRPADLVRSSAPDGLPPPESVAVAGRSEDDPGLLADLLAVPQVHLIVDAYNVTKTGYGSLALVEQRRRLIDSLGGLVARTGAEVTCCFDGAEVDAAAAYRDRGVRVMFSAPPLIADDLVRQLVRAEPPGRPVVVVSSDAEVVRGVRAAGAVAVPARALLRLVSQR